MDIEEKFSPIRKGLLEFVILQVVAGEKLYVAEMLKRLAETDFATQEGTLYPLLSRMRRESLVDYEWQESESGPPRKYYKLTATGKSTLRELQEYWQHLSDTITKLGR
jgi:PadR family transcriptional regulator PadR